MRKKLLVLLLGLSLVACQHHGGTSVAAGPKPPAVAAGTFANPLLPSGPDPWVYQKDGFYYFLRTTGGDVRIRKTARMTELAASTEQTVWQPTGTGRDAHDVWAPELHFLDGKWYIYFTAGPGRCCDGQRLWVLENASADPTQGTWTEKGRIYCPTADFWAIDGTVFEQGGQHYLLWSGHRDNTDNMQRLYIARMRNPWALAGPRVELSRPQYRWEQQGTPPVNEGPEILQHGASTFLIYSASHCSTDAYALGQLRISRTADPLVPANWTKSATPVFGTDTAAGAYGPGHNAFFKSKDGTEDWLIYHANSRPGQGCGNTRNPRMQKFTWNPDGSPHFGSPVPITVPLPRPAGE